MTWIITGEQKNNWTPADIDTALWFDAADASTITESGGAVSQWDDKSGNGDNAIWAASKPTYELGAFNGKDSIYFNDTDVFNISGFNPVSYTHLTLPTTSRV